MFRRFPKLQDVLPVYAVIATILYGWSMVAFAWKLPSWIRFLHVGEILSILAYTLTINLMESLLWLGFILLTAVILPASYVRDEFPKRGTILGMVLLGSFALFMNRFGVNGPTFLKFMLVWSLVTVVIAAFLSYASTRVSFLGNTALWIADRSIVFLFLYVPLSLVSLIAVILRNAG